MGLRARRPGPAVAAIVAPSETNRVPSQVTLPLSSPSTLRSRSDRKFPSNAEWRSIKLAVSNEATVSSFQSRSPAERSRISHLHARKVVRTSTDPDAQNQVWAAMSRSSVPAAGHSRGGRQGDPCAIRRGHRNVTGYDCSIMDRNGRCMNVTSYFPVGKDLESLRAEDRTPHTAGDGHVGSADDGVDVSLLCNENGVSGSQRAFDATVNVQGAARLEIAAPRC